MTSHLSKMGGDERQQVLCMVNGFQLCNWDEFETAQLEGNIWQPSLMFHHVSDAKRRFLVIPKPTQDRKSVGMVTLKITATGQFQHVREDDDEGRGLDVKTLCSTTPLNMAAVLYTTLGYTRACQFLDTLFPRAISIRRLKKFTQRLRDSGEFCSVCLRGQQNTESLPCMHCVMPDFALYVQSRVKELYCREVITDITLTTQPHPVS